MFRLPEQPEDPNLPLVPVPAATRNQLLDFDYPDVVIARAAFFYAQTDPVMQPRAQTLEAGYKDVMYQLMERDKQVTDTPVINEWMLPVQAGLHSNIQWNPLHPYSN